MNVGEAIKRIELIYPYVDDITQQALRKAIKALEKNISEPVVQCEDATFECPLCGAKVKLEDKFCLCGQRLSWRFLND